jgi:hypothetical protein
MNSNVGSETGSINEWYAARGVCAADSQVGGTSPCPSASQTRAKNGSWSTKFEANSTQSNYYAQVSSVFPTSYMGGSTSSSDSGPNGGFTSGYYSWWLYIDAGFVDQSGWESHLG